MVLSYVVNPQERGRNFENLGSGGTSMFAMKYSKDKTSSPWWPLYTNAVPILKEIVLMILAALEISYLGHVDSRPVNI